MSYDGDGRNVVEQTENVRWLFPLRGERVRVREVVNTILPAKREMFDAD
jgi:hypothetical protein